MKQFRCTPEPQRQSTRRGWALAGTFALTLACERPEEPSGMHGDLDMASEESHNQAIDELPVLSDPMDIEKVLRANPESPYFAWSHLYSGPDETEAGHIYFAVVAENTYQGSVTLNNQAPDVRVDVALTAQPCKDVAINRGAASAPLGQVQVDDVGRTSLTKIEFSEEDLGGELAMSACDTTDYYIALSSNGERVACGKFDCLPEHLNNVRAD